MTALWDLAERAGAGIGELLRRGRVVATWTAFGAAGAGVFCVAAVVAVTTGPVRAAALGLVVAGSAVPVGAALLAGLVLDRARRRSGLVIDIRRLVDDPATRGAVDAVGAVSMGRRRMMATGGLLWALRRLVADRRTELADLWISVLALTRLPLLVGVALVGSLALVAVGVTVWAAAALI